MVTDFRGERVRLRPDPAACSRLYRDNMDTFDRAGWNAEVTAGTFTGNHGMHLLGGTQNGIYRAGLDAQGAANTYLFIDYNHGFFAVLAMLGVQWLGVHSQQVGQCQYGAFATRRALIDICLTGRHCFCIGTAAGIGALAALCLRQQGVNLVHDRIALDAKPNRGITQYQANHYSQESERY